MTFQAIYSFPMFRPYERYFGGPILVHITQFFLPIVYCKFGPLHCHLIFSSEFPSTNAFLFFLLFRRNQNFKDILNNLTLGQKDLNAFDLTKQFHHVFWYGDLNYRLRGDAQVRVA